MLIFHQANSDNQLSLSLQAQVPCNPHNQCWQHGCERRHFPTAQALGIHRSHEARQTRKAERMSNEALLERVVIRLGRERHRRAPYAFDHDGHFFLGYAEALRDSGHQRWEHGCEGRRFPNIWGLRRHQSHKARQTSQAERMSNEVLLALARKSTAAERRLQAPYVFDCAGHFFLEYAQLRSQLY